MGRMSTGESVRPSASLSCRWGLGPFLALSKSKKHYVGLTWAAADQKGGFAMQCDKNEYRGILAGLEGVSGKKAIDSDAMTVKN